jgi:glycosyltransferase involved in cell wall biosynthesis
MNILNVTTIRELRGGDAQMYTIYKLLKVKIDLKQYILCPQNSDLALMCKTDGESVITYKRNRFKKINTILKIIESCKTHKIDLIHVHDSAALTCSLIAMKFLNYQPKLVLSRKRNNKIKPFFLNKYKYSHPYITKIISVSKAVEGIFEGIVTDKNRLLTIYDAIDVKKVSEKSNKQIIHKKYNLPADTLIIGNTAALDDQKDLFTFIDTAKKILTNKSNLPDIKFFIFGRGPKKDALNQYIIDNKLENSVVLGGFRTDILDILPEFDLLLMTSIEEGLPLSIYEAFATRVPVVSTDAGGIKEVVITNETGFVANQKDSTSLAMLCLKVLEDPILKNNITTNAFEIVIDKHDLKNFEENYYKFYKSI